MNSRERVQAAIHHRQPDRVPIDLGSTPVTGIHASTYARVREALGFPHQRVKVGEPFQMLAELESEVADRLGVDTLAVQLPNTLFGFPNENWKPFDLFDGTPVLVSEHFQVTQDTNGDLLIHPQGERDAPPSGRMPQGGDFFDAIVRQEPDPENQLDPRAFAEQQIGRYTERELEFLHRSADELYRNTDKALIGCWFQGGLGDIALVPGLHLAQPKGIRDPQRWYEMLAEKPEYAREIFSIQTDIACDNLKRYHEAVGNRIEVIVMSGTDFGTQRGPMLSPIMYRELWKPFHKRLNDWVHDHTTWKTFYHSCGSVIAFLEDFIDAGVDILNPVQCSAAGMEAQQLKHTYGDRLVFWGGGVDTQRTLPFGNPDDVRREATERIRILGEGGGYVFNTIHNIQAKVPTENVLALFETVQGHPLTPQSPATARTKPFSAADDVTSCP